MRFPFGVVHNQNDYSKILTVEDEKEPGKMSMVSLDQEQALILAHALITPPGEIRLQYQTQKSVPSKTEGLD